MAASIKKAPSIFYYLNMEEGQDPERTLFADATGIDGKPIYYAAMGADDPLEALPFWVGKLALALGNRRGDAVSKQSLAAVWFGIDPKDGVSSLLRDGPSVADQVRAQQAVAKAETRLFNAAGHLKDRRAKLANAGSAKELVEGDAKVKKLSAEVERLKGALDKATRHEANRTNAHDITFSAPKGVSVLWARYKTEGLAGDAESAKKAKAMEEAMAEAVANVVEKYIEPQLLFTRSREGAHKERRHDHVEGVAAALFMHFEARPTTETVLDPAAPGGERVVERMPDPQMHIHALLMNLGLDDSDEIRALWTNFLGSHIKVVGAAFRGELAHKLRALGLELSVDEQERILSFDVSGVTDEIAGAFSARRAQVEANLARGMDSEDAGLSGRSSKAKYDGSQLLADWSRRMDDMGLSSSAIESATNSSIAMAQAVESVARAKEAGEMPFGPGSAQWLGAIDRKYKSALAKLEGAPPSVEAAVAKLLEMETAFTLSDVHRAAFEASQFCGELSPGKSPMEWAADFGAAILSHRELKRVHGLDEYGRPTFTSNGLLRREKELYFASIPKLLAPRSDMLTAEAADDAIARYETSQSAKMGKPFVLEQFQRDMVHNIARNPGSIHIALAPAGSGKTTSILGAVMALEQAGGRVFSLAPSIKAAQGLASGIRKTRADGISPEAFHNGVANGSIVLTSKDLIIMDESSMVGFENAKRVVDAALGAEGGPCRTVWIGDTEQLPSVGRGNFLRTLAESEAFTVEGGAGVATITKVARTMADWINIQRQSDDLGKQATTFFALGDTAKAIDIYERMGAMSMSATREQALEGLAYDSYLPLAGAAEDYNAALAERGGRYRAFAKRGNATALNVARAHGGACSAEDFIAEFSAADREQASQWFEDKLAIDKARAPLMLAYSDTLILATRKANVADLNRRSREILKTIGALGGVDGLQRLTIPRGRVGLFEICEGERLVFTQKADATMAKFSIAGDIAAKTTVGTVVAIAKNIHGDAILTMRLDGGDGGLVEVNTAVFDKFNYAYAMTAHASQGATCRRVYKFLDDFAAMQTEYVGDSRHKDILGMRVVESEYAIYKKRAAEAIEKTDAKDLAFAANHFSLDNDQLAALDQSWEEGRARAASLAFEVGESRHRAIAQGELIAHGAAPLGFTEGRTNSHFAKLMVQGRVVTLWGSGLEQAIAELGATVGDHVGLEALSGVNGAGAATHWRGYSSDQLGAAGLLLDRKGLAALASGTVSARGGVAAPSEDSMEGIVETPFMTNKEALAITQSVIARAAEVSALRVQERGALDEVGRMATLPADLDERLEAAKGALPFAKAGSGDKIRAALASGITAMPYARPMFKEGREWLASDAELSYCLTEWGSVEAWSSKDLGASALAEAAQGGQVERLARRQIDALALARRVALDPVKQAFGALGERMQISIVEHAQLGLCVGLNARVPGGHKTDPELKRAFAGRSEYGQDAHLARGGIKGLKRCEKYDKAAEAWLFKLECDTHGAPQGPQPAVAELVELGERLGHTLAARSPWDVRRARAWDGIESRLGAPWGLAFAQSTAAMGIKLHAQRGVLSGFPEKSKDIFRWDEAVRADMDQTQRWSMCPTVGAEGEKLAGGARRLAGIVLHADDHDIFVMRDLEILAIGRAELALDEPSDELIGQRVAVSFKPIEGGNRAAANLEFLQLDPVLDAGKRAAARISSGEKFDPAKLSVGHAAAFARACKLGAGTPEDLGHALAWAGREATQLEAIRAWRAEGIETESVDAAPLEALSAPDKLRPKKAKVLAVGAHGVVIAIGARKFLADKDEMRMAMPRQLKVGKSVNLSLARGATGRIKVDSAATARSLCVAAM